MKTNFKFFFVASLLAATFLLLPSFKLAGGDDNGKTLKFYQTYDDFLKGHVTSTWTNYVRKKGGLDRFSAVIDGKKEDNGDFSKVDDWGYLDEDGHTWRITVDGKMSVICYGKICLYVSSYYYVHVSGMNETAKAEWFKDDRDGWVIFLSKGGTAKPEMCTNKALKKYFTDDQALLDKLAANEPSDYKPKKWLNDFNNIISWVNEYNKTHK